MVVLVVADLLLLVRMEEKYEYEISKDMFGCNENLNIVSGLILVKHLIHSPNMGPSHCEEMMKVVLHLILPPLGPDECIAIHPLVQIIIMIWVPEIGMVLSEALPISFNNQKLQHLVYIEIPTTRIMGFRLP